MRGREKANAWVIVPTAQNEVEAAIKRSGLQPKQIQATTANRCERSKGWETEKHATKRSEVRALATYVGTTQGLPRVEAFGNTNQLKDILPKPSTARSPLATAGEPKIRSSRRT